MNIIKNYLHKPEIIFNLKHYVRYSLLTIILFSTYTTGLSQFQNNKTFVYGTLSGETTHTGYFWFDNVLTQMGQRILFKENPDSKKKKTFYAHNFTVFSNDSLVLRTFKTIPYGTGRLSAMIPRIVSGKLELYVSKFAGHYLVKASDHFYLFDGVENTRLVRRKFKEQMSEILSDDAEIVRRIQLEELSYDDMPAIIYNYNLRHQDTKTNVTLTE